MAFHQLGLVDFEEPFTRFVAHGMIVRDGAKMSKSKGNVINPDEYIREYGADAFRVYLMFMGAYLEGGDFRDEGVRAMRAFLERVVLAADPEGLINAAPDDEETLYWLHHTIKAVTMDMARFSYNTALARMMELVNHVQRTGRRHRLVIETLLKLLSPFAPFLTEELWNRLGHKTSVHQQAWPVHDEKLAERQTVEYVVQVNGKVRARLMIPMGLPVETTEAMVLAEPNVQKWLEGKTVVNRVFVPNKLMNLVVK
jgi:leucyl-tRNA synthetase